MSIIVLTFRLAPVPNIILYPILNTLALSTVIVEPDFLDITAVGDTYCLI